MNLRNNKGFSGIDITIAVLIIVIFVPTIFGITYNIQVTNGTIKREYYAISIATDVLETAKSIDFNSVTLENDSIFIQKLNSKYQSSQTTYEEEPDYEYIYYSTTGTKEESYQIQIGLMNYSPEGETEKDLVKRVKVTVIYPVANTTKTINISTVLQNN